jgi:predicted dehydrogenase
MNGKMNRRGFIKAGAAAGIGYFAVADVTESRAVRQNDPLNRLNIAIIGAGGQGGGNLGSLAKLNENIVALCDVDARQASGSFKKYPTVATYQDYRVMLDKQKDIQAVVVSTPDHHHVFASMAAMKMGKHVYCEKPLTHSVWEARQMRELAAKQKVATQMGNSGTAGAGFREGVEVVRSGAIGEVREVHCWTNRPIWPQEMDQPAPPQVVPKTMAWDLWLGPAPARPYNAAYAPFNWRGWWDFGTGAIGDMACHTMNQAYMALELGAPSSIVAETDRPVNNQSPPSRQPADGMPGAGLVVTYVFPARGKRPAVTMKWYEVRRPPLELLQGQKFVESGCLMVGSKGTFYSPSDYGGSYRLLPVKNFEGYKPPQPTLPRSPGHHAEWIRACKGGTPAMANFDYAGPLTEMALLGNVAIRAGKRIDWDAANLRARGLAAADQYIRREYRKGWTF